MCSRATDCTAMVNCLEHGVGQKLALPTANVTRVTMLDVMASAGAGTRGGACHVSNPVR